jgi:two-component system cell cycle sensor histidine kinase/response regulator CckA
MMLKFPRFGAATATPKPDGGNTIGPIPPGATVVLLVDDEPAVRNLFALALTREGYHVIEAGNGAEALEVAKQLETIDLVVTDIVMPVMKGPELAMRLRERFPDLKFVFVSGYLVSDDLGPNSHMLAKPFVRQDLVKKVLEVVGPPRTI